MAIEFDKARDEILRREMRTAGVAAILGRYPEDLVMMAGTWPCLGMNLCLYPVEGQPVYYMSPNEPLDVCPPGFALRRFAVDPDHDDFEPLALSRFIEEGALAV